MEKILVACWTCYRLSNRLQPGKHPAFLSDLTRETIAAWDEARDARMAAR